VGNTEMLSWAVMFGAIGPMEGELIDYIPTWHHGLGIMRFLPRRARKNAPMKAGEQYGGFKFAMFYIGEYVAIVTMSALVTTLFWGGWHGPFLPGVVWFALKMFAFIFFFVWIRATLPRVRHDQLMAFGWKVLVPLGLLNVVITAIIVVLLQ